MRRSLGALVVLLASLSACTSGHDGSRSSTTTATQVPALTRAWATTTAGRPYRAWVVGRALVTIDGTGLTGLDASTGRRDWKLRLPSSVCGWSTPGPVGLLAVLTATRSRHFCRTVEVVDLRRGKVLWTRGVDDPVDYSRARFDGVSVGRSVVAVTDSVLAAFVRLDARTGQVLSRTPDANRWERQSAVSDGRHIFALRYSTRLDGPTRVVVTDQETGRRVGTFDGGDTTRLQPVLADPPLVGGKAGNYLWSATTGRLVGRGLPDAAAASGDRLAAAYPGLLAVDDLRSGRELAALPLTATDVLIGTSGDAAIVRSHLPGSSEWPNTVERVDLADPARSPAVLGTVPDQPMAVGGGLLFAQLANGVAAYRLPDSGPALSTFEDGLAWERGDLRPGQVLDACRSVTAATRQQAGADPDAPLVGSCVWGGSSALSVSTTAEMPTRSTSAVALAESALQDASSDAVATRLGDGAWIRTEPGAFASAAYLTFRFHNVIVTIDAHGEGRAGKLRSAALAAGREVLAELERRAA